MDPLELNSHEGVLEMGEVCISSSMGEYSSREGLGVSGQNAYPGFITPVWEVVFKMGEFVFLLPWVNILHLRMGRGYVQGFYILTLELLGSESVCCLPGLELAPYFLAAEWGCYATVSCCSCFDQHIQYYLNLNLGQDQRNLTDKFG